MQNDTLKNRIAPWQEKGRWYHAHITETGLDSANTDQFLIDNLSVSTNTANAKLTDVNHKVIDVKFIINEATTGSLRTNYYCILVFTDGCSGALIPRPDQYTVLDCDCYFFIQ